MEFYNKKHTYFLLEQIFKSNNNLITIINKTKRAFDWGGILTNTSSTEKVTDIVEYNGRTITITE